MSGSFKVMSVTGINGRIVFEVEHYSEFGQVRFLEEYDFQGRKQDLEMPFVLHIIRQNHEQEHKVGYDGRSKGKAQIKDVPQEDHDGLDTLDDRLSSMANKTYSAVTLKEQE